MITIIGYFPKSYFKIIDLFTYLKVYFKLIKIELKKNGNPLYIHTYVFFPAGLLSYYFAKKLELKNVLTEHWSIIYPYNEFSISKKFLPFKLLLCNILRSFDLILPVVRALDDAISFWAPNVKKVVVSNVVNTSLFFFNDEKKYEEFTFLHVSCMENHKNPMGILDGFELNLLLNQNTRLKLIGPKKKELLKRVNMSKVLKSRVDFLGEMSNSEVAKIMQKSHVLVMNSFYESQPCVILEALCCGLPIVSSNVGGIPEIINLSNGVLFEQGDLAAALKKIFLIYPKFSYQTISQYATEKFSQMAVSNKLIEVLNAQKIIDNTFQC